jgi:urease gamma subunit
MCARRRRRRTPPCATTRWAEGLLRATSAHTTDEGVAETARDGRAEVELVLAAEMVPKAEVAEAVENALHAFGVGRLDVAFEVLRGLLARVKPAP